MDIGLKKLCFTLWKPIDIRKGIQPEFKPEFIRYVGVENTSEYDNILKTFQLNAENDREHTIIFDGEIPSSVDFRFITAVTNQLNTIDIHHLTKEDISMFENRPDLDEQFVKALQHQIDKAVELEDFMSVSVQNNFIVSLMMYFFVNIQKMSFDGSQMHAIYYGDIDRRDLYFLFLLHDMGFDVIFINPVRDEHWSEIDTEQESRRVSYLQNLPIESFAVKCQRGRRIAEDMTLTLELEQQMTDTLFTGTGAFRPWQLRGYQLIPVFVKGNLIDLKNNWNEHANIRQGFSVKGREVMLPHCLYRVAGEDDQYPELMHTLLRSKQAFLIRSAGELYRMDGSDAVKSALVFCQLCDGTFSLEKIRQLDCWPFGKYEDVTQQYIMNTINAVIESGGILKDRIDTQDERIDFVELVLRMNLRIADMMDAFDYPNEVPKVVFFMEKGREFSREECYLIAFLNEAGFDICVLAPGAQDGMDAYIDGFNHIRLATINRERTYESIRQKTKGWFARLFG